LNRKLNRSVIKFTNIWRLRGLSDSARLIKSLCK